MEQKTIHLSFRRRGSGKRPIHSIKHVIDSQLGIIAATQQLVTIVKAKDAPSLGNTNEVETGSRVNAFFLNCQIAASSTAALANIYFYLFKNQGNNIPSSEFPDGNVVGANNMKNLVFHQEMLMTEKNTTAVARTMFRGVIMIPKHMRRMGVNDEIIIAIFAPGVNFDFCLQSIYKEYR